MTDISSLRARGPAYVFMRRCLEIQAAHPARGFLGRLVGRTPLHPDAVPWYRGALGELQVAGELTALGPDWTVLNAVPVGAHDADIDHILIGPAGVFILNTKNHVGEKIWVGGDNFVADGRRMPHLERARSEARDVATRLSRHLGSLVRVTPLVAVIGAASLARGVKPTEVTVIDSRELAAWLAAQPDALTPEQRSEIDAIAERRSTWHAMAVSPDDTQPHLRRFDRLRAEVDEATRRSRLTLLAGGVVLIAFAISSVAWMPSLIRVLLHR